MRTRHRFWCHFDIFTLLRNIMSPMKTCYNMPYYVLASNTGEMKVGICISLALKRKLLGKRGVFNETLPLPLTVGGGCECTTVP